MPATQTLPRRSVRQAPPATAKRVHEMLLEIAHRLHATKAVAQVAPAGRSSS